MPVVHPLTCTGAGRRWPRRGPADRYARRIVVDPRRLLSLVVALGFAVVLLAAAPARAAGGEVAQEDPATTVSAVGDTTAESTSPDGAGTDQTVVESPTSDRRLATENRRMLAIIGALIAVALGLTLLTVRYVRATRPVADDGTAAPAPRRRRKARGAVAGADHAAADDDWEPRATGEHTAIAPRPATPFVRPGTDARRRALGLPADG